jgi:hypothetical protein
MDELPRHHHKGHAIRHKKMQFDVPDECSMAKDIVLNGSVNVPFVPGESNPFGDT